MEVEGNKGKERLRYFHRENKKTYIFVPMDGQNFLEGGILVKGVYNRKNEEAINYIKKSVLGLSEADTIGSIWCVDLGEDWRFDYEFSLYLPSHVRGQSARYFDILVESKEVTLDLKGKTRKLYGLVSEYDSLFRTLHTHEKERRLSEKESAKTSKRLKNRVLEIDGLWHGMFDENKGKILLSPEELPTETPDDEPPF